MSVCTLGWQRSLACSVQSNAECLELLQRLGLKKQEYHVSSSGGSRDRHTGLEGREDRWIALIFLDHLTSGTSVEHNAHLEGRASPV